MLARIKYTANVNGAMQYNEEKISRGQAEGIWAENFMTAFSALSLADKQARFLQRTSLNEHWLHHGMHISLNFGAKEPMDNRKMVEIARAYMKGLGLEDQPYLVYRHHDAAHVHCHIVTPKVDEHGRNIIIPFDWRRSRKICQALEERFGLERYLKNRGMGPADYAVKEAQTVEYGEKPLRRALSEVLNTVVDHYQYSNLEELDAVLRQYQVTMWRGREGSKLQQFGGLLYQATDGEGKPAGPPIKASAFLLKPTLRHLRERFALHEANREKLQEKVRASIDWTFAGKAPDWDQFTQRMGQRGIDVVSVSTPGQEKEAFYFINHTDKYVVSGQSLGPGYQMEALRERCVQQEKIALEEAQKRALKIHI